LRGAFYFRAQAKSTGGQVGSGVVKCRYKQGELVSRLSGFGRHPCWCDV